MVKIEYKIGDCLELIKKVTDGSIDIVTTSPPYNVGIDYGNGKEADNKPFSQYHEFALAITKELFRVLKDGGRFCIEIGSSGRNFPLSWCWQDVAFKNGFGLFSEIIIDHRKTNETAWGSWLKADNVYTIPNFHVAYVFYKNSETKRGARTTITRDEFVEWTRGRWKINYSMRKTDHPAEFPLELPLRFMKLFGHEGDWVLDPFVGSGTTLLACRIANRNGLGFEINPKYEPIIRQRIMVDIQDITTYAAALEAFIK